MNDLIDFLFRNPILLLLLGSWVVSMIGGAMQKAAKRAEQQKRAERRTQGAPAQQTTAQQTTAQRTGPDRGGGSPAGQRKPRRTPQSGNEPSPEEIAREIRQAMGLERPQRQPAPAQGAGDPARGAVRPRTAEPPLPPPLRTEKEPAVKPVRTTLAEELAVKQRRELVLGRLQTPKGPVGDVIHTGQVGSGEGGRSARRRSRGRPIRRLLDLSRPASGLLAMEVLGPPVTLRPRGLTPHEQ